jgi:2-methylcitrate dehydratase PrpD
MSFAKDKDLATLVAEAALRVPERITMEVAERAVHLVLDSIGCGLAAQAQGLGKQLSDSLHAWRDSGEHVVVGASERLTARDAALLNGALMHSLEFDDVHMASVMHLTCAVLPAVLATGVHAGKSGQDVLFAYVAGLEIGARLGMADGGGFQARGFHPTSVVGTFAAACACALLLDADAVQLRRSQGIALSLASGAMQFLEGGGTTKRLHPGWAAQAGMQAAMMAMQGIDAPERALEGKFGLYRSFLGREIDVAALTASLASVGRQWETLAIAIKPFPSAYYGHACVEAAIELAHYDNLHLEEIEEVIAHIPSPVVSKIGEPLAAKQRPTSSAAAQFSLPYLVAAGLCRRQLTLAELEPASFNDPVILAMAARVRCEGDPDTAFPKVYPGALSIRLKNGHTLTKQIPVNLGAVERPIANGFIVDKFVRSVGTPGAPVLARALLDLGSVLDMRAYTALLAGSASVALAA